MNTIKHSLILALSLLSSSLYCASSVKSVLRKAAKTWGIKHVPTLAGAAALYGAYSIGDRYSPLFRNNISAPMRYNLKRYMRNLRHGDKSTLIGTGVVVGAAAGAYYYRNELIDAAYSLINRFNSTGGDSSFIEPPPGAGSNHSNDPSGPGSWQEVNDNGLIAEAAKLKDTLLSSLGALTGRRGILLGQIQTFQETLRYPDLSPDYARASRELQDLNREIAGYEAALGAFGN